MLGGMGCRGSEMKAGFRACLNQAGMKLTFVCLGGAGAASLSSFGGMGSLLVVVGRTVGQSVVGRSFGRSVSRSATVILEIFPFPATKVVSS